ncbi:MAG: DUF2490 domain-containing protein, partial [Gammaproteobacteria bacterium]
MSKKIDRSTASLCLSLFFCLAMLSPPSAQADHSVADSGLWTQLDISVDLAHISPKTERFLLSYVGEARFFDQFSRFTQGVVRVMPGYRFDDNITLFFGYTWVPSTPEQNPDFAEHDINQAFNWSSNQGWGNFSARS